MSPEWKLALGASATLHAAFLVGWPATAPAQFDVERSPMSVEIVIVATPKTEEAVEQHLPPESIPELRENAPQGSIESAPPTVVSQQQGAITEVLPSYLRNPPPVYPRLARERGEEGLVTLDVEVLSSGQCGHIRVLTASGHPLLDETALQAVRAWRFEPARRLGQPVDVWVQIPIRFQLLSAKE